MRSIQNITAVAAKELRLYCTTWVSYALVAAFIEILAAFFTLFIQDFQLERLHLAETHQAAALQSMNLTDAVLAPFFTYSATCLTFLLPLLTMHLLAGERRAYTLELLLTLPLRPSELVLGKYVAACGVLTLMLLATLPFPWVLHSFAAADANAIDWPTVVTSYLGLWAVGAAAIAIGLLASALTDSQVVAAVLSVATLLLLQLAGAAASAQPDAVRAVFEGLSLGHHLAGFTRGLLRVEDLVYFLSLVVGPLVLAAQRLGPLASERQR